MRVQSLPFPKSIRFAFYFLIGSGVIALTTLMTHLPAFGGQWAAY